MRTYVRYCLAAVLLSYGWSKVVPVQFGRIGPDSMVVSYGELSPMGLLWRFMATSTAYQVFSGLSEVLAGALLLFRRTMLPGAFLAVVVLTNIAMLNFCFDVPVKIYSTNLLLMGLFLLAPDAMRLLGVSVLNLPVQPALRHPFPIRRTWIRRLLTVAGVALIFLIAVYPVFGELAHYREQSRAIAASPLHGGWGVDSFAADGLSGRALPDDLRWVRVGINAARGRIEVRHRGRRARQRSGSSSTKRKHVNPDAAWRLVQGHAPDDAAGGGNGPTRGRPLRSIEPYPPPPASRRRRPPDEPRISLDQRVAVQPVEGAGAARR